LRELEPSLRRGCERSEFRVVHYSVQRNHAHFIVESSSTGALSCGLRSLCSRFARAANRVIRRTGKVLVDRCHVRTLRTPREARHAIAYVLLNARKHAAEYGRVARTAVAPDPASSGRWFDGWKNPVRPPIDPPAVARPQSWLLSKGWRSWRLLALDEIPGS
jgi:hypothetical protein